MKNKVLKFLFPIPTIVLTAICCSSTINYFGFIKGAFITIIFFIVAMLPLDLILWIAYQIKNPRIKEIVKVKCPNCGKLLGTDYLFCTSCGYSLTKPAASVPKPIETKTQPIAQKPKIKEKPVGIMGSKLTPELERFAEKCVAYCELDKKQNPKTPEFVGNFRFDDKRFNDLEEDVDIKHEISPDTIRKIGDIILATYKYYDVAVRIADIRMTRTYVIYCLVPIPGVKKDAVCNLQTELSIAFRTDVFMNVVYEKGYIGLFIATDYCRRFKSI